MILVNLHIDGQLIEPDHTCAVRFGGSGPETFCDLYIGGKRVVKPWKLTLQAERTEDEPGNANTAT